MKIQNYNFSWFGLQLQCYCTSFNEIKTHRFIHLHLWQFLPNQTIIYQQTAIRENFVLQSESTISTYDLSELDFPIRFSHPFDIVFPKKIKQRVVWGSVLTNILNLCGQIVQKKQWTVRCIVLSICQNTLKSVKLFW